MTVGTVEKPLPEKSLSKKRTADGKLNVKVSKAPKIVEKTVEEGSPIQDKTAKSKATETKSIEVKPAAKKVKVEKDTKVKSEETEAMNVSPSGEDKTPTANMFEAKPALKK